MTVLAQTWADDLPEIAGPTLPLQDKAQNCCTEEIEETEETREIDVVGGDLQNELNVAIEACRLQSTHASNKVLFELARRVRGVEKRKNVLLSPTLLRSVFDCWHRKHKDFLRPGHDYYCEFLVKLNTVRHPWGETLGSALRAAYRQKASVRVNGITDPDVHVLASLCRELQYRAGPEPFYLTGRACAQLLARPHSTVANWLRAFQTLGVIKIVKKGRQNMGSRYRYIAGD